jgi:dihydrofolate synthase/folylpolyglutamate synthase
VPVIYDGRNPESESVILAKAKEMHAPAWRYDDSMREITGKTDKSIDFILDSRYDKKNTAAKAAGSVTDLYGRIQVRVPYLAEYQIVNSALAMAALRVIDPEKTISDEQVIRGIETTNWQGRMETVLPDVVLDGAHNADGIREFIRTVCSVQERREVSLLFSAVVEKEYEKMIRTICESIQPTSIVVTQVGGARVVPAQELADDFRKYTTAPVIAKERVADAFDEALARRGDSMLFCAGSLYLVGELKAIIKERYA